MKTLWFLLFLLLIRLIAILLVYAVLDLVILPEATTEYDYRHGIIAIVIDIIFIIYIIKYYYPQGLNFKKVFKKIHYILVIKYTFLFFLIVYLPYLSIIHFYYGGDIFFSPMNLTNYSLFFLVNTLLVVPFVEEFFYRKFMLDFLTLKYNVYFIGIASSIIFACSHFFSHHLNIIFFFIFGILSFYIYHKTKNLTISVYLHFLYNLSSYLFTWEY